MRALAVDWSGRATGAGEFIWLAEARDGDLVRLCNGRGREEVVARLVELAAGDPELVVGLDFAFSFPEWWCVQEGLRDVRSVWRAMRDRGEELLARCDDPFWGRPERRNRVPADRRLRATEAELGAKSVFQIGGAGAVGTGSIRGMPHLLTLADAGFSVWPFDPPGWPRVVEIYPRALTGPVTKTRWRDRWEHLGRYPRLSRAMRERAAGSEDAFDAAVSALVMSEHAGELAALEPVRSPPAAIEGRIWLPGGR